ncbi:hypothetical protein O181_041490 [Austropuccinia psidii MF-1]|uniref:Uncharacterized protein n=1 Tax=Austropuccinia psidii MF-1 TaxID=1389203 RepID=A0A9Q3HH70_9BASI|nr:hypothetical protein [Austropuccinia psidii MF-1]
MGSKLTELTESSPSAPPPSVLCGSGVFSQLSSPSMASSGHFIPPKSIMDTEQLKFFILPVLNVWPRKPCRHTRVPSSNGRRYLWSRKDGPFGKEFPVSEAPTPDGTSGFSQSTGSRQRDVARWTNVEGQIPIGGRPIYSSSEVPISRINTEGVVKQIRRIADSPTDPDDEGSDELDGEEVVVVPNSVGHPSRNSSAWLLASRFQSQVIPSTPRTFQPVLSSIPTKIPPSSPSTSHPRPALNPAVRPSTSQKPIKSPISTSQQLPPEASSSRRRDGLSPLLFPSTQVFQRRDCWPIQITREDPNAASGNQEAVARFFRRADRNSREVIMYANDRTVPGTASEKMAAKFAWYEDELINHFQRTFDDLGRDQSFPYPCLCVV